MNTAESARIRTLPWRVTMGVFVVVLALNLVWLGHAPLADSTEARHAEVGREFAEGGPPCGGLVPTLNYRPHLTKPPLTDWLVAVGLIVFGENEFGARFGNAIVAALGIALVAGFGCRLGGKHTGLAAAVFWFICPLYLALSRTISIDIFLATAAVGAFWAAWEASRMECARPRLAALCWGACLGLGGLAKGHIILLVVVAPVVVWIVSGRRWRLAKRLLWPPAILLFLAVALPWYLYIHTRFPGWLGAIVEQEFKQRVIGTRFGNSWKGVAFVCFLGGALPTVPMAFMPFVRPRNHIPTRESDKSATVLLWLWLAVPLAVFSMANCQRANYVIPLLPPAAIMAGLGWSQLAAQWSRATRWQRATAYLAAGTLTVCSTGSLLAYITLSPKADGSAITSLPFFVAGAAACALASAACILRLARGRPDRAAAMFLVSAAFLWALSLPLQDVVKAPRSTRLTSRWIKENLDVESKVIFCRYYMPSCSFYTGRYLQPFRAKAPGIEWQQYWQTPGLPPGVATWRDLDHLARLKGGIWLILESQRLDDIRELKRALHLHMDVKQLDPEVVLAHLFDEPD
ncbi:hypothetical protein AMJ85_10520 [candidate division BRC1 bacterium SM23_51]|nr:MAG: hypothetical protein AMJ85_10520 [candidate division BRC1 bacterium SM23_51]